MTVLLRRDASSRGVITTIHSISLSTSALIRLKNGGVRNELV